MMDKVLPRAELAQGRRRTRRAGGGRRTPRARDVGPETTPAPQWLGGRASGTVETPPEGMTVHDVLAWHGLPEPLVMALAEGDLCAGLERLLSFSSFDLEPGAPLAFCGPPGGGRTLALAKMAARYAQRERHEQAVPLVISGEATPEGAARLTAWLKPYGVPVFRAATGDAAREIMARKHSMQPVLLDLPEGGVYAPGGFGSVRDMIAHTGASPVAVLPAGMDAEEAADVAAAYTQLGARRLIASRLDHAGRIGSVITAGACGLALSYVGYSASVRGGLARCTAALLARRLMVVPG